MPSHNYLTYRGDITAIAGVGTVLLIGTIHDEGQATGIYRVELDKLEGAAAAKAMTTVELDGVRALLATSETLFALTAAGELFGLAADATGKAKRLGSFPGATTLCSVVGGIALGAANDLIVVSAKGKEAQRFTLEEPITALAADETGEWLVAGTKTGKIAVFEREEKSAFVASESVGVHQGAVTALAFDPDELRVLSAGTDQKLVQTFVRGALAPEDRGGRGMHDQAITALLIGPGERYFSASADRVIKQWPIGKGGRPSSMRDGTGAGTALALVERNGRPHLAQACSDQTVRLFAIDGDGALSAHTITLHGAMAAAKQQLGSKDPTVRGKALTTLAGYNDVAALTALASHVGQEADPAVAVDATERLAKTGNPRAEALLGALMTSQLEPVRAAAFEGYRACASGSPLDVVDAGLTSSFENVALLALSGLCELAAKDDQARTRLIGTLGASFEAVRKNALEGLVGLFPKDSPDGELIALGATKADIRRAAFLRLHDRNLLGLPKVQAALSRAGSDPNDDVRQTAFLLSLLTRKGLAEAVRYGDTDVHRLLWELENRGAKKPKKRPKAKKADASKLAADAVDPLLEAMVSPVLDVAIWGTRALAALGDPRALGALLQLSRESQVVGRVAACKALEILDDRRATQRLRQMLRDSELDVRDAAFTALSRLMSSSPLEAAEAGLMGEHEDVRKRGLEVLVKVLRKKRGKGKSAKPVAIKKDAAESALLRRALNDHASKIRSEAFKAVLNLQVCTGKFGDDGDVLRFALASIHADVRREVMIEVIGRISEKWAWPLLLELFADPDSGIRGEAFAAARKQTKGKAALEPLKAALTGPYPDLRIAATKVLAERRDKGTVLLLVQALEDEDNTVRQLAVDALVTQGVQSALVTAMASEWRNVRVRAAAARAELGDRAALDPLLQEIRRERPTFDDERELWQSYLVLALQGLADLGATDALGDLVPLLQYDELVIRAHAARALAWSASADHTDELSAALAHEDGNVSYYAALGLALQGNPIGASTIARYVENQNRNRRAIRRGRNLVGPDDTFRALVASLSLPGHDFFLSFLDHASSDIREHAFAMVLLLELVSGDAQPTLLLAAASSNDASLRLAAAGGVELWHERERFEAFVVGQLNDRGDHRTPAETSPERIRGLAAMLAHGTAQARARFAHTLWYQTEHDDETGELQRVLERVETRHESELTAALAAVSDEPRAPGDDRAEVVLGAYFGATRDRSRALRARAIRTLVAYAGEDKDRRRTVIPPLRVLLRDFNSSVRSEAFAGLRTLGLSAEALAADSLASGHQDLAGQSLELMIGEVDAKSANAMLVDLVINRTDGVAFRALTFLNERDPKAALEAAFSSSHRSVRSRMINMIGGLMAQSWAHKIAQAQLKSRFADVRNGVALALALHRKDKKAVPVLVDLLGSGDGGEQQRATRALLYIGGAKPLAAIFDRIENDPKGTADGNAILTAILSARDEAAAPATLNLVRENKGLRDTAFRTVLAISGYDQWISDPNDEQEDRSWTKNQNPRRDEILASLLEVVRELGHTKKIAQLIPGARWSPSAAVNQGLDALASHPEERVRQAALEAIGFRARKRGGSASALVPALGYPDPRTQFLGAEGLALSGDKRGLGVLLTSAEMLEDVDDRARAVTALGELADERALDLLLRLVETEENDAVSMAAAAGLGRLGQSAKADQIFQILKARTTDDEDDVVISAIKGLRWFGTPPAWDLIRGLVKHDAWDVRQAVVEALADDTDPASLDALVTRLGEDEDDHDVATAATKALRQHYGPESLEVDYIIATSPFEELEPDTVKRLREQGDPVRLVAILDKLHSETAEEYGNAIREALLEREPAPLDALAGALESTGVESRNLAARGLGVQGEAVRKAHGKAVAGAASVARGEWFEWLDRLGIRGQVISYHRDFTLRTRLWARLIWACGRVGVGADEVIEAATTSAHTGPVQLVRLSALEALASGLGKKEGRAAVVAALHDGDAEIRLAAASALRALDAKEAAAAVAQSLDDSTTLGRLLDTGQKTAVAALSGAAGDVHRQGVVLPHLVSLAAIESLAAIAGDAAAADVARMGAIEALARIPDEKVDTPILALAKNEEEDDDLRKAAWRALRRARRLRADR